jgi:hypothetical protein
MPHTLRRWFASAALIAFVPSTGTEMKAFAQKLTVHETWDVVNYLRSIGPAKSR